MATEEMTVAQLVEKLGKVRQDAPVALLVRMPGKKPSGPFPVAVGELVGVDEWEEGVNIRADHPDLRGDEQHG